MSRGHGPPQLGTLSNPGRTLRLQHQFLPSQQTQHYQQTQPLTRGVAASGSHNGAKTLYATHGTIANAPRFNQNSYEVSPASSFRYYSSSVEYLADHNGQLNKSSPDSGYPGENGDLSNGFYENLPFHGMKQQPQQPHKQPLILRPKLEADTEPADLEDDLVYADSDYRDLYAYGPVSYTQTSRHAAQTKKEEIAKRYGTIGRK